MTIHAAATEHRRRTLVLLTLAGLLGACGDAQLGLEETTIATTSPGPSATDEADGRAATVSDFTAPFAGTRPAIGARPLLVVLLGPANPDFPHALSREHFRDKLFGESGSVADYFLETSYGHFTFSEALVTPWLEAQDDPSTPDVDESTPDYIYNSQIEKKSAHVIRQVEQQTSFRFADYDKNSDGLVTTDELCVLWIYPGGNLGRVRGIDPNPVPVPSLARGYGGDLARVGEYSTTAVWAHELAHVALGVQDLYTDGVHPGVSGYSLLGQHHYFGHIDPWTKIKAGWLRPILVGHDRWLNVRATELDPVAYILHDPERGTQDYFIIPISRPRLI